MRRTKNGKTVTNPGKAGRFHAKTPAKRTRAYLDTVREQRAAAVHFWMANDGDADAQQTTDTQEDTPESSDAQAAQ